MFSRCSVTYIMYISYNEGNKIFLILSIIKYDSQIYNTAKPNLLNHLTAQASKNNLPIFYPNYAIYEDVKLDNTLESKDVLINNNQ